MEDHIGGEPGHEHVVCLEGESLSIGGRPTLIKSVLDSILIYYLSLFKALLEIINLLESLRARFFLGYKDGARGISWVKWNSILLNHKIGRLGVGNIHAKNLGLLGKWKWRHRHGTWCEILKAVDNIKKIDHSFEGSSSLKISNGSNAMFWKDPWVNGGTRLKDLYPRLFAINSCLDCTISDKYGLNSFWSGMWSWRCLPRGRAINDVSSLFSLIALVPTISGTFGFRAKSIFAFGVLRSIGYLLDDHSKVLNEDIFPFIQRVSKACISARCKVPFASWSCWISKPRSLYLVI
nr:reverse transcriptase domain, reverse transcriptase zinc-binding domain protein [Tanacetum cinerariifolium]